MVGQWQPAVDGNACPECATYLDAHPHLVGACASVGIEHGKSTRQMLREYLATFHDRGHEAA